jgi:serine/threonine protein kinase
VSDLLLEGRYRLETALRQGPVASTWKALDTRSGGPCVVKVLSVGAAVRHGSPAQSWDGDFTKVIELFEREARILANLDHPGIPRFVDHFRTEADDDVRLYTVQEYVEGRNLLDHMAGGRHFTEEEATAVCRAVAEILGYLHDRSPPLVHRDVKPSNVILSDDGGVHLVDFGSVRNALDRDVLEGKTIVGTYGYMPMEQYEGRAVPQSDFYALGMTLVHLLSHRDPTAITRTGMALEFRPLVNVSERFASLIDWMIQPAPEDRPQSAARILAALDPNLDNLPARRLPEGGSGLDRRLRDRPEVARARGAAAFVVGVVLLLLSLAGFFLGGLGF